MKLRVRQELEQRRGGGDAVRQRLADAARSLDRAFIGTIHAFCAQLLRRRPVEARVDPVFQELAQPEALRVFGGVFRRWIEQRLAAPSPALTRALARLAWREERDGASRSMRCARRRGIWRSGAISMRRGTSAAFDRDARLKELIEGRKRSWSCATRERAAVRATGCSRLANSSRVASARAGLDPNLAESELLRLPRELRWVKAQGSRDAVFAAWEELKAGDRGVRARGRCGPGGAPARRAVGSGRALSAGEAAGRAARLHGPAAVRARSCCGTTARARNCSSVYQRIFVDEFQDTDPLQAEILLLLAADPPSAIGEGAPARQAVRGGRPEAVDLPVPPRRRAAVSTRICRELRRRASASEELTSSTRSTDGDPGVRQRGVRAARFRITCRSRAASEGPRSSRRSSRCPCRSRTARAICRTSRSRSARPNAVAAFIEWLCDESGWKVRDRSTGRMGAGAARARLHPVPPLHEFRRRPDAGVRARRWRRAGSRTCWWARNRSIAAKRWGRCAPRCAPSSGRTMS